MTRKDIIHAVAEETGLPIVSVRQVVERTFDSVITLLAEEGRAELRNFGVFEVRRRKPRKARNPRTGEKVTVPEHYAVRFKPGQLLEALVGGKGRARAGGNGVTDQD